MATDSPNRSGVRKCDACNQLLVPNIFREPTLHFCCSQCVGLYAQRQFGHLVPVQVVELANRVYPLCAANQRGEGVGAAYLFLLQQARLVWPNLEPTPLHRW